MFWKEEVRKWTVFVIPNCAGERRKGVLSGGGVQAATSWWIRRLCSRLGRHMFGQICHNKLCESVEQIDSLRATDWFVVGEGGGVWRGLWRHNFWLQKMWESMGQEVM